MVRVRLRVLRPAASENALKGEDWGEWQFVSLPRTGDQIDLHRNECTELLTVRRIVHFASQHPLPRSERPYRQRKEPSICILAVRAALTRSGISASLFDLNGSFRGAIVPSFALAQEKA
jgi:hypothetical protein